MNYSYVVGAHFNAWHGLAALGFLLVLVWLGFLAELAEGKNAVRLRLLWLASLIIAVFFAGAYVP